MKIYKNAKIKEGSERQKRSVFSVKHLVKFASLNLSAQSNQVIRLKSILYQINIRLISK